MHKSEFSKVLASGKYRLFIQMVRCFYEDQTMTLLAQVLDCIKLKSSILVQTHNTKAVFKECNTKVWKNQVEHLKWLFVRNCSSEKDTSALDKTSCCVESDRLLVPKNWIFEVSSKRSENSILTAHSGIVLSISFASTSSVPVVDWKVHVAQQNLLKTNMVSEKDVDAGRSVSFLQLMIIENPWTVVK